MTPVQIRSKKQDGQPIAVQLASIQCKMTQGKIRSFILLDLLMPYFTRPIEVAPVWMACVCSLSQGILFTLNKPLSLYADENYRSVNAVCPGPFLEVIGSYRLNNTPG